MCAIEDIIERKRKRESKKENKKERKKEKTKRKKEKVGKKREKNTMNERRTVSGRNINIKDQNEIYENISWKRCKKTLR